MNAWTDCHEEVNRMGQLEPCEEVAIANRIDPESHDPYPVCVEHVRGDMVPLLSVVEAALGVTTTDERAPFARNASHDYEFALLSFAAARMINGGTDWEVVAGFESEADANQYRDFVNGSGDDAPLTVRAVGTARHAPNATKGMLVDPR